MALGSCYTCIKYLMFAFNFLFWLLGCAILGVGIWLRVDDSASEYVSESTKTNYFYTIAYVMIAVGFIIMIIGFLGCCGAIRESQCMLATFFIFLFIIFAILLGVGIFAAVAKDSFKELLDDSLKDAVDNYYKSESQKAYMDTIQTSLQCCGYKTGATDYLPNPAPETCHDDDKMKPCSDRLFQEAESKMVIVAGILIGIAVVMILGMIFSMALCCAIRDTVA